MADLSSSIDPDTPIRNKRDDLFFFSQFAGALATHIQSYKGSDSFVVGLEGSWGSGKSSFLNLLDQAFTERISDNKAIPKPTLIWYSPWIIGNRTTLLADFLLFICTRLIGDTRYRNGLIQYVIRFKNQFWSYRNLRKYAKAISNNDQKTEFFSKVASNAGIPLLSDVWKIIKSIFGIFRLKPDSTNFDELRRSASLALQKQKKQVIVIIDDIDRLERDEIMAIFRLVRSTAQLPHITYILSYDANQLYKLLDTDSNFYDSTFTEKIFQLLVRVPRIEPSYLASNLKKKLVIYLSHHIHDFSNDHRNDLTLTSAIENLTRLQLLKTPRDVKRLFNAFTLSVSSVGSQPPNLSDLLLNCALQINFPNVYEWTYEYTKLAHTIPEPLVEPETKQELVKNLLNACKQDGIELPNLEAIFEKIVPNIKWSFLK